MEKIPACHAVRLPLHEGVDYGRRADEYSYSPANDGHTNEPT
jgi:hypothetical protein